MTDEIEIDLLEKLRLWASTEPSHVIDDLHKAADEIERLRYEVQRFKQLAKREIVMCDPNDPCEMCKELAADDGVQ
jgi:hypothetical protein